LQRSYTTARSPPQTSLRAPTAFAKRKKVPRLCTSVRSLRKKKERLFYTALIEGLRNPRRRIKPFGILPNPGGGGVVCLKKKGGRRCRKAGQRKVEFCKKEWARTFKSHVVVGEKRGDAVARLAGGGWSLNLRGEVQVLDFQSSRAWKKDTYHSERRAATKEPVTVHEGHLPAGNAMRAKKETKGVVRLPAKFACSGARKRGSPRGERPCFRAEVSFAELRS